MTAALDAQYAPKWVDQDAVALQRCEKEASELTGHLYLPETSSAGDVDNTASLLVFGR